MLGPRFNKFKNAVWPGVLKVSSQKEYNVAEVQNGQAS